MFFTHADSLDTTITKEPNGARVERHPARSGPAALPRTAGVFPAVRGGGDASTGRRSRREAVTLERGFDGAARREPAVRQRAPRSSARSADERRALGQTEAQRRFVPSSTLLGLFWFGQESILRNIEVINYLYSPLHH